MEITQTRIDKSKERIEKTRLAIELALKGRWDEAVRVNQYILDIFPDDIETLNRLGKAYMESGRYAEARNAFEHALRISPHNAIAKKNLERLPRIESTSNRGSQPTVTIRHRLIEQSDRSGVTELTGLAEWEVLARIMPGDAIKLDPEGHTVTVRNLAGEYIGQIEPRVGARLGRMMKGGNKYEGVVVSVRPERVSLLLIETFRQQNQPGLVSLLSREYQALFQDTVPQYIADDGDDGDDSDEAGDWRERLDMTPLAMADDTEGELEAA
jgi:tetratricopeptide (TPR) repeat protein